MGKDTPKDNGTSAEVINHLNRALELEYSLIVHYPRLASSIPDDETRKLVLQLGTASTHHADVVAKAIVQLGGQPNWSFAPFPDNYDMLHIFQIQLGKEKEALELHRETARLVPPGPLADSFANLALEEQRHIDTVNQIISGLAHP